jgi:hypothetical protein
MRSKPFVAWELPAEDGAWSRDRFAAFVTGNLGPSIDVKISTASPNANSSSTSTGLFVVLDADGDKKLSPEEVASSRRMWRRDWDEDGTLSQEELLFAEIAGAVPDRGPNTTSTRFTPVQVVGGSIASAQFVQLGNAPTL